MRGEETWVVRGGSTTFWTETDSVSMQPTSPDEAADGWLNIAAVDKGDARPSLQQYTFTIPVSSDSTLTVAVDDNDHLSAIGDIHHASGLRVKSDGGAMSLSQLVFLRDRAGPGDRFVGEDAADPTVDALVLHDVNVQLDRRTRTVVISSDRVSLSPGWATALGNPALSECRIGAVIINADVALIAGSVAASGFDGTSGQTRLVRVAGVQPDIIVGQLNGTLAAGSHLTCRDSGLACEVDADCSFCTGIGLPPCGMALPCKTDDDCKTCAVTGEPCRAPGDCAMLCSDNDDVCATNEDCTVGSCDGSGGVCHSNSACPAGGCSGGDTPAGGCRSDADCRGVDSTCTAPPPEVCTGGATCDVQACASVESCVPTGEPCDVPVAGFGIATTSCNIGNAVADWFEFSNQHPVIAQNMYRLKGHRFEQIGMSWVKHGFSVVAREVCGSCNDAGSNHLGIGCSDLYTATLNATQPRLGPRSQVNAHTGAFPFPFSALDFETNIDRRLQVREADLDLVENAGAQYFVEGIYIHPGDAAGGGTPTDPHDVAMANNNASYRRVVVTQTEDGRYKLEQSNQAAEDLTVREAAVRAWAAFDGDPEFEVVETDIQVPGEGLFILAAKARNPGTGVWRYEYALENLNSDQSARSFSIPVPPDAIVTNVGFHAVEYHSGEPYDRSDWNSVVENGAVTWWTDTYAENACANALRWGTLYNFWFDANVGPGESSTVTLGLFKPGAHTSRSAMSVGPAAVVDCNNNSIPDACDISCAAGGCTEPCGGFTDCNQNGVPDDPLCESDCNNNGVADECDVGCPDCAAPTPQTSEDCNADQVPDECNADCDEDGIPDACDIPDTDGDGFEDCVDLCPLSTPMNVCACPEFVDCCWPDFGCLPNYTIQQCLDVFGEPSCQPSDACIEGCVIGDGMDMEEVAAFQQCYRGAPGESAAGEPSPACLNLFDSNADGALGPVDYQSLYQQMIGASAP